MAMRGRVHRFGDDISTDVHLSVKYRSPGTSLEELKRDAFKELDPDFSDKRTSQATWWWRGRTSGSSAAGRIPPWCCASWA